MYTQFDYVQDFQTAEHPVCKIRNQSVADPTPDEIRERAAEIRKGWNATRWSKERRHLRQNRWTAPQVSVSQSLLQTNLFI
jgi:hypothetical protein